ncbi:tRNA (guanine(46)-N(7))-methyltransferase TrmB [Limibacillus halophilus]|jgi:tRNA (guanine-N7-)-methyltransferase
MAASPKQQPDSAEKPRKPLYGRRKGRPLRANQKAALDKLLPRLRIDLESIPADPRGLFTPRAERLWLEIGFGGGEHCAWQAKHNPSAGLIGAEFFINGVASLLKQLDDQQSENVRVHEGDALDLLAALPESCLDRVFILFADPWPKARHHKRRIVSRQTLDRLAELMKPGAELRVATDDPSYRLWILERVTDHPWFDWTAQEPNDWRERPEDWPPTRYEEKAIREGRKPVYLRLLRRRAAREKA